MAYKTVDDFLNEAMDGRQEHTTEGAATVTGSVGEPEPSTIPLTLPQLHTGSSTMVGRVLGDWVKGTKEREAERLVYDTLLNQLRHRATAAERESKAFWDAKSVQIAESIKTYAQGALRAVELERTKNKDDMLIAVSEWASQKLAEIQRRPLAEALKERLMLRVLNNLDDTLDAITNDTLAGKYDLK